MTRRLLHVHDALTMRAHPLGANAQIIGRVTSESSGLVTMKSRIGAARIVDMLSGEQFAANLLNWKRLGRLRFLRAHATCAKQSPTLA